MFEHDLARRSTMLGWCLHGAGLAAVLAAATLAYGLVLRPLERRTGDWEDRIARLEERLKGIDAFRAEQSRLSQRVAELDQKSAALSRRVPGEPMEAEFLSQVAGVAVQAGVKLGHYRPGLIRVGEGHSQMEIQLSCAGPYRGLCQFLDRLAAMERLSRVVQMEVGSGGAEGCPATITLVVFFRLTEPPRASSSREGEAVHG